jgi:shikimate kinase
MLVYIIGFMGAGKSTVAKSLSARLNYASIDTDYMIEKESGMTIEEIFRVHGESFFRTLEIRYLNSTSHLKNTVISVGGGTPCVQNAMDIMNSNGLTLYLKQNKGFLLNRLQNSRKIRPMIAGLSKDELGPFIEKMLLIREPFYMKSKLVIDGLNVNIGQLSDLIHQIEYSPIL